MTIDDHLLWILAEECAEVAQRASKAARFGIHEVQPGQDESNKLRLMHEVFDLLAVVRMMEERGLLLRERGYQEERIRAKIEKVEKFLAYSAECGRLE